MNRGDLVKLAAIAAGVVVVGAVGVAAFLSMQTPFQAPAAQPSTDACTPQPCLNVRGYILWVSDAKVADGVVSMQVRFQNSSSATHADPADLELNAQNKLYKAVHDAPGCTAWPRTDFSHGATFGPVPECFRPASTAPPLALHWSPDLGLFCCEADLLLVSPSGVPLSGVAS